MAKNTVTPKDSERQEAEEEAKLTATTDQFMEACGRLCVEHGRVCMELAKLKIGAEEGKADSDLISNQFSDIKRIGNVLAVLREGVRDAVSFDEINAWQGITETILEQEITAINYILWSFSKTFDGIGYKPILTDSSCGRSNATKFLLEEIEKGMDGNEAGRAA